MILYMLVYILPPSKELRVTVDIHQIQEAKRLAQSQTVLPNGDAKVKSEL